MAKPLAYKPTYLRDCRVEDLTAAELKTLIVDASLVGYLTKAEAEDMILLFRLRNA